jgi:DNA-directed RNA polymerase subunit RPC12/RpoP
MNLGETEYYCNNCGAQIKPTDTICPKCGKKISEVGKNIRKTVIEVLGLADSAKTITGSLADGYAQLSGTFNVQQKSIAGSYNFASSFERLTETLKNIAESDKKLVQLTEQQRNDAIQETKKQRKWLYITTAITIIAIIVTIIVWAFPRI